MRKLAVSMLLVLIQGRTPIAQSAQVQIMGLAMQHVLGMSEAAALPTGLVWV